MNNHVESLHEGKNTFKCDICDYSCSSLRNMLNPFMKEKRHSNVTVALTAVLERVT
jgi:hypothetical protein